MIKKSSTIRFSTVVKMLYRFYKDFNIESCKSINSVDDFRKCVNDIHNFIQNKIIITNSVDENYECVEECVILVDSLSEMLENFENKYNMFLRAYTTAGDSEFDKEDKNIPKPIKRIIRHLEISEDLTVFHVVRYALAKNTANKLVECLVTKCGLSKVEKLINEFLEMITRKKVNDEYTLFVVEKITNWLNKIKGITNVEKQ